MATREELYMSKMTKHRPGFSNIKYIIAEELNEG